MKNAPNLLLMGSLFCVYNLLIILFAIGIFIYLEIPNKTKKNIWAIILLIVGILGLLTIFFPQDPRGEESTTTGTVHILLAGIMSLLTIILILLAAFTFRIDSKLRRLWIFSVISCTIIIITGGLAAFTVANNSEYGGLFERLTILTFIIWILIISINLLLLELKRESEPT